MGLFGINIDLKDILNEKLLHSTLISMGSGLLFYTLIDENYIQASLVGIGVFLLIALILWGTHKWNSYNQRKVKEEKAIQARRSELTYIANEIRTFFLSLDDELIDYAIKFYELPRIEGARYNERYVDAFEYSNLLQNLYRFGKEDIACIYEDKSVRERSHTRKRRIVFDPMFYCLLVNYIKTNKKCYPSDFDVIEYNSCYRYDLFIR